MIFDNEPLSVRNNNPGNIRSSKGGFKRFDDPNEGLNAMRSDLLAKITGKSSAMAAKYGDDYTPTIRSLISTWAPENENDTDNYINHVVKETGIDPDVQLAASDVDRIMPAMIKMEGGSAAQQHFATATDAPDPRAAAYSKAASILAKKYAVPEQKKEQPQESISKALAGTGEALLRQAGQGGTFGFMDEGQDLIGAGIAHAVTGEPFNDLYKDARRISKEDLESDIKNHPGASIAGNIGGAMLTGGAVAGGVKSLGARFAPQALETVVNAANALPKTTAILTGAGSGGLYGAGQGEGGLTDRLGNAGSGALVGGPSGILGYGAAKGVSRIAQSPMGQAIGNKLSAVASPILSRAKQAIRQTGGMLDDAPTVNAASVDDLLAPQVAPSAAGVNPENLSPMKLAGILDESDLANLQKGRALPMTRGDRTQNVNLQRMEQIAAENGSEPMIAARGQQQAASRKPFENVLGVDISSDPVDLRMVEQSEAEKAAAALRGSFDSLKGKENAAWKAARDTGEGVGIRTQNVNDDLIGSVDNFLAENQYRPGDIPALDKHMSELKSIISDDAGGALKPEAKLKELEAWKTRLNGIIGDTPMDKANTKRILQNVSRRYDEFTSNLADDAIVNGDDEAIKAFKNARSLSKERFGFLDSDKAVTRILDNRDLSGEQLVNVILGSEKLTGKGNNGRLIETMLNRAGDRAPDMQEAIKRGIMAKAFRRSVTQTADPSDISKNLVSFDKMRNEIGNIMSKKEIFTKVFDDNEQQYMRQMYDDLKLVSSKQKGAVNNSSTGAYMADMMSGIGKIFNNSMMLNIPGTKAIDGLLQRQAAAILTNKAEKGLDEFIVQQFNNMDAKPAFYGAISGSAVDPDAILNITIRPSDKEKK